MKFFKELSKSIPDYRKIVLLVFLFKNDDDLLKMLVLVKVTSIDYLQKLKVFCTINLKTILFILKTKKKLLLNDCLLNKCKMTIIVYVWTVKVY